jgi:hypothetical protein
MYAVIEAEVFKVENCAGGMYISAYAFGAIFLGERTATSRRPWCARITGFDDRWVYKREFMSGTRDYTRTNNADSRGTYVYYHLPPGIYEICRDVTWQRYERFFLLATKDGNWREISTEDVKQWLNQQNDT